MEKSDAPLLKTLNRFEAGYAKQFGKEKVGEPGWSE